jgi:predicted dehydrogenase
MTLRFGMIGASTIGAEALLEPVRRRNDIQVVHVAARRPGAAHSYAQKWAVPRASSDYEDVLADAQVDAVYVSNSAADHARWTIAALEAGKHVLCEKPIALTGEEARAVEDAARGAGRIAMEGFHYRFHPLFLSLEQLVATGRYGSLQSIRSLINGARPYDPTSILHMRDLGGGALLHNGVYGVHWTRLLFDAEPTAVHASQQSNPSGADSDTSAEFEFPGGRTASLHCSFDRSDPVSLTLVFEKAEVVVTGPIGPHHGHSLRIEPTAGPSEVATVAGRSSFDYQLEEFARRALARAQIGGRGDDIVANAITIDAIRRAASSGRAEAIGD